MISNRLEKWIKISISIVMILITVVFVFGILSYFYFTYGLPSIETLRNYKPSTITRFFADDGELIGEFFFEKREVVSLARMPNHLIQAFVAGEDARFFQHRGSIILLLSEPCPGIFFQERFFKGVVPSPSRWLNHSSSPRKRVFQGRSVRPSWPSRLKKISPRKKFSFYISIKSIWGVELMGSLRRPRIILENRLKN